MLVLVFFMLIVNVEGGDPEAAMTTPEIIRYWGYPVEIVPVTTADGYILEMHRIPYGRKGPQGGYRPVIFLQHGLLCDSAIWVLNTPIYSAGFIFADAGFDVWLGNFRGNYYSKKHTTYSTADSCFWEFTWDQMAKYDLDAMITRALIISGQDSLYYVGHSQGTLTMFAKLSSDAVFSQKIRKFFALAPIGNMVHVDGFFGLLTKNVGTELEYLFDIFGRNEFLPFTYMSYLYAEAVCANPGGSEVCTQSFFLIGGQQTNQFNRCRVSIYASHFRSGTSVMNIAHFLQLTDSDCIIRRYDYRNAAKNLAVYGSTVPPAYNFGAIQTEMYLYWANEDYIAAPQDVQQTISMLNAAYIKQSNHLVGYNHGDFVNGLRAPAEIYYPIVQIVRTDFAARQG